MVLSAANQLYLYPQDGHGRIGSILQQDLSNNSTWGICVSYPDHRLSKKSNTNNLEPNSTVLKAISAAWGMAVLLVQHYETHILQVPVKRDIAPIPANVILSVQIWRCPRGD